MAKLPKIRLCACPVGMMFFSQSKPGLPGQDQTAEILQGFVWHQ